MPALRMRYFLIHFCPILGVAGGFPIYIGHATNFLTDTHHVMLMAVADSYTLFIPGAVP